MFGVFTCPFNEQLLGDIYQPGTGQDEANQDFLYLRGSCFMRQQGGLQYNENGYGKCLCNDQDCLQVPLSLVKT